MEVALTKFAVIHSGTLLIRSPMGEKKNLAVLKMVFFKKKLYGDFCQAVKKIGRNNEVTDFRGGRKAGSRDCMHDVACSTIINTCFLFLLRTEGRRQFIGKC